MNIFNFINNYYILSLAGRKEDALKKYLNLADQQAIEEFSQADPSGNLKYLDWQMKMYLANYHVDEIIDIVRLFHNHSNKLNKKDINQYKPEEFQDLKNKLLLLDQEKQKKQERVQEIACGNKIVYESDRFIVRHVFNKAATIHYGKGTKWCISALDKNKLPFYEGFNAVFFFIINKNNIDTYANSYAKIAIVVNRDHQNNIEKIYFMDATDEPIQNSFIKKYLENEYSTIMSIVKNEAKIYPISLYAKFLSGKANNQELDNFVDYILKNKDGIDINIGDLKKNELFHYFHKYDNLSKNILSKIYLNEDLNELVGQKTTILNHPSFSYEFLKEQLKINKFKNFGYLNDEIKGKLLNDKSFIKETNSKPMKSLKNENDIFWGIPGTKILHREDGPAVKKNNNLFWYKYNLLHREDGPAIIWENGDTEWWLNGFRHRVGGPAVNKNGNRIYFDNGVIHREDGPAIELANGEVKWVLDGKEYSKTEYKKRLQEMKKQASAKKNKKRVDLDVRPHPSPFYSNYDYVDESKYQKENGTKGPGGGLYHGNMDKYKSVKEFIETDRKRRRKQRKKALWSIIKNEKISST